MVSARRVLGSTSMASRDRAGSRWLEAQQPSVGQSGAHDGVKKQPVSPGKLAVQPQGNVCLGDRGGIRNPVQLTIKLKSVVKIFDPIDPFSL